MGEAAVLERVVEEGKGGGRKRVCSGDDGIRCALRSNDVLVQLRADHLGLLDIEHPDRRADEAKRLILGVNTLLESLCNGSEGCISDIYRDYIEHSVKPELRAMRYYAESSI